MRTLLFIVTMMFLQLGVAGSEHAPASSKQFEDLKQLLGIWQGDVEMGENKVPMTVVYELTSGGSVITETLMAGTPQEMISVYHKEGDSVAMTHYCTMGNQPHMKLKKADGNTLAFEMREPVGIVSKNEAHMHAVTLTMKDKNTLQQDWVFYEGGKAAKTSTFLLKKQN